ncbi:hypothetical protein THIOM_003206 [Candidatus Thiomargarita nelsonii]|uniref:Uncharacterized protein n=1 Tax=Candidatus Thiomargarita nelsonii TaxID=1003181 RepID=A0A176RZ16_9GAMM|nr:hypothetical protein THIOM_003206 [Candidatus Thiomargarita nelsonii]
MRIMSKGRVRPTHQSALWINGAWDAPYACLTWYVGFQKKLHLTLEVEPQRNPIF